MPLKPSDLQVLVVMDDVYAQKALSEYSRNGGYRVTSVNDARKAAAIIGQNTVHLIIVDLGKKAGGDFVTAIKKHKPGIRALGLVDEKPNIEDQARDAVDGYLVRPVSQETLTDQLNELLLRDPEAGPPPRVIIIDDDADAITAAEHILSVRGFEPAGFQDPGEGLAAISENPPDVIILDIEMPNTTGFEILEHLKKDPETADIPVLIFTSDPSRENVQKAIEGGAKGFLAKPFDAKSLTAKVRSLL